MVSLSIIVPIYNPGKHLIQCIHSIRSQHLEKIEICLVDDGSEDSSSILCDQLVNLDHRIIVIHKKNSGVSASRNAGLTLVCGEYITFVDSDDWVDAEMYSSMLNIASSYNCDVVMCDCIREFNNSSICNSQRIREGYYSYDQLKKEYYPHLLAMEYYDYPPTISNWLCVFRRPIVENLRYVEGIRYSEDLFFGSQVMLLAKSFYYMKGNPFYHYRVNQLSVSHRKDYFKWKDYSELYKKIYEFFSGRDEFDFSNQISMVFLIFFFNSINDILAGKELPIQKRKALIKEILDDEMVYCSFRKINLFTFPVSVKFKGRIFLYKRKAIFNHYIQKLT